MELPETPTLEEILAHINTFKVKALNLAMSKVTDVDANMLEPREIKTLVDLAINIEDSLEYRGEEGKQARLIQKLLTKYDNTDYNEEFEIPAVKPITIDTDIL